jgi:hypothetical protein
MSYFTDTLADEYRMLLAYDDVLLSAGPTARALILLGVLLVRRYRSQRLDSRAIPYPSVRPKRAPRDVLAVDATRRSKQSYG